MTRRLGRLPHDPVALAAAPSLAAHRFAATPPPAKLDRRHVDFTPGLFRNDVFPDCTAAALMNAASMVAAVNGYALKIDAAKIPAFYAGCAGCGVDDAAITATDGAVLLDVLGRQRARGFDIGGPTSLAGLFGTLPLRRAVVASAMARLGHAYVGVTLHERDMELRPVWDVVPGRDDGAVAGGHCVVLWDYGSLTDDGLVRVGTWGAWQPATWAWLAARMDEAHALVWRQLARADRGDGVDIDVLAADLVAWAA